MYSSGMKAVQSLQYTCRHRICRPGHKQTYKRHKDTDVHRCGSEERAFWNVDCASELPGRTGHDLFKACFCRVGAGHVAWYPRLIGDHGFFAIKGLGLTAR
jgi:hypothetical protein